MKTDTETAQPDLVQEVEALLTKTAPDGKIRDGASAYLFDMLGPELLRRLVEEVKRLKRGEFTPEEFQELCHNGDIQAGFDTFADGCEAYQQKMFGRCRTKGKSL